MDQVLIPQQSPGGGSAISVHFGRKVVWASYLCLIVVSFQFLKQTADAAPVLASSYGYCQNVTTKVPPKWLDCCLPTPNSTQAKPFVPPGSDFLRERKPAHVLAQDRIYVEKYNRAYELMRNLTKGDPLSFDTQWKYHCAFCSDAYLLGNTTSSIEVNHPLQIHYSWLFLPWHRMYIYFHEKMLGKLINDPNFTLPFWNWDNQLNDSAAQMPAFFIPGFTINNTLIKNSALISENRNKKHFPPSILDLSYSSEAEIEGNAPNKTDAEIRQGNLACIYNSVVNQVSSIQYLGDTYGPVPNNSTDIIRDTRKSTGSSENLHNAAHEWVGLVNDPLRPDNDDMGTFIFSGKDPMFYTHHTNMDRLWDVWKTLNDTVTNSSTRRREDSTDRDFLESEFTFHDENGELVTVKVKDTLDSANLGITYTQMQESDSHWINYIPKSSTSRITEQTWKPSDYPVAVSTDNTTYTIYDDPVTFMVARRTPNGTDLIGKPIKHVNQLAEGVVMEEVKIPRNLYVRLDAYVNEPSANKTYNCTSSRYVGTSTHLPSAPANTTHDELEEEEEFRIVNIRYVISPSLRLLGISDYNTQITITIVPKMRLNRTIPITFTSLRQEFQ